VTSGFLRGYFMLTKTSASNLCPLRQSVYIGRVQSSIYIGKSRYICCKHNTIKNLLSNEIILINYVKSQENIVDSLTKNLSRELLYSLSKRMDLRPIKIK
jgi:hypothetical protein